jgi:para-aminobenzoate synthetase component 1
MPDSERNAGFPGGAARGSIRQVTLARTADFAHVGGRLATDLREITDDVSALDRPGFWIVAATFEGAFTCARFADVQRKKSLDDVGAVAPRWRGPRPAEWTSSLDQPRYVAAVETVRDRIAAGEVYQVNLCRTLSAPSDAMDLAGLAALLADRHPSRYPALLHLPSANLRICSASPELFLARRGDHVETRPIKGTARTSSEMLEKDRAENVMIVDMARNDLGRVAVNGGVRVGGLCELEPYPGLVQLVSTVAARLRPGVGWAQLLTATFPPASVSGAPKSSALRLIRELEPAPRGPYCGAVGYVDNTSAEAALAVAIRTFWLDDVGSDAARLCFGTGAGITWGSDPLREWDETTLKAGRLIELASAATATTAAR